MALTEEKKGRGWAFCPINTMQVKQKTPWPSSSTFKVAQMVLHRMKTGPGAGSVVNSNTMANLGIASLVFANVVPKATREAMHGAIDNLHAELKKATCATFDASSPSSSHLTSTPGEEVDTPALAAHVSHVTGLQFDAAADDSPGGGIANDDDATVGRRRARDDSLSSGSSARSASKSRMGFTPQDHERLRPKPDECHRRHSSGRSPRTCVAHTSLTRAQEC